MFFRNKKVAAEEAASPAAGAAVSPADGEAVAAADAAGGKSGGPEAAAEVPQTPPIVYQTHRRQGFVLDGHSFSRWLWDSAVVGLAVLLAFATPVRVAFHDDFRHRDSITELLTLTWTVFKALDVVFLLDMFLSAFTAVYAPRQAQWLESRAEITAWYFRGDFKWDLLSILPWDVLAVFGGGMLDESVDRKLLFVGMATARVLQMLGLLKVVRLRRILNRWRDHLTISFGRQLMYASVLGVLLVAHWSACSMRLTASVVREQCRVYQCDDNNTTATSADEEACYAAECTDNWLEVYGQPDAVVFMQYLLALHWAVAALKSADRDAQAPVEVGLGIVVMVVGVLLCAVLLAEFVAAWVHADQATSDYRRVTANMDRYMRIHNFEKPLQKKLRAYFRHSRHMFVDQHYKEALQVLPPSLRNEVVFRENAVWFAKVPLLAVAMAPVEARTERLAFVTELALALAPVVYCPGEFLVVKGAVRQALHVLDRGTAEIHPFDADGEPADYPHALGPGSFFGGNVVLGLVSSKPTPSNVTVVATSYLDCRVLTTDRLANVLDSGLFPGTRKACRDAAFTVLMQQQLAPFLLKQHNRMANATPQPHKAKLSFPQLTAELAAMQNRSRPAASGRPAQPAASRASGSLGAQRQQARPGPQPASMDAEMMAHMQKISQQPGISPAQMDELGERFEVVTRGYKEMQYSVEGVSSELKTLRRDMAEFSEAQTTALTAAVAGAAAAAMANGTMPPAAGAALPQQQQQQQAAGAASGLPTVRAPNLPDDAPDSGPGVVAMMVVDPSNMPPGMLNIMPGMEKKAVDRRMDVKHEETAFASALLMDEARDKVKILEERVQTLIKFQTASAQQSQLAAGVDEVEKKLVNIDKRHTEIRHKARDQIKAFHARKEARILSRRTQRPVTADQQSLSANQRPLAADWSS